MQSLKACGPSAMLPAPACPAADSIFLPQLLRLCPHQAVPVLVGSALVQSLSQLLLYHAIVPAGLFNRFLVRAVLLLEVRLGQCCLCDVLLQREQGHHFFPLGLVDDKPHPHLCDKRSLHHADRAEMLSTRKNSHSN